MQAIFSRSNHFQNLISIAIPLLIICYYAFNRVTNDSLENARFIIENPQEPNKSIELEKNICHLRAAVLMDADVVEINGLLFQVETSLGNFTHKQKAKSVVQNIYKSLLSGNRKQAIRLINQLPTLLLLKQQSSIFRV